MKKRFKNFLELLDYFNNEARCRKLLEIQRWKGQIECPHCSDNRKIYITNRGYKCSTCMKKFSVTVGTPLENTKLPLRLWFAAIYLHTSNKKGVSSYYISRMLGCTQGTAWFLLHRIREMMKDKSADLLRNVVEIDETFIGGKRENKHKKQREELSKHGEGYVNMAPVVGMIERSGKIRLITIPGHKVNGEILKPLVYENVAKGTVVITDGFGGYYGLKKDFSHEVLQKSKNEFKRGDFHTNNIENFWSLLKRGIYGIYHKVDPEHLTRYCAEFAYRFNTRKISNNERFMETLNNSNNSRLKYSELIK